MHSYHLLSLALAFAASFSSVQAECCGVGECVSWDTVPGRPGKPDKEVCNRWKCADGHHHGWAGCCGLSKCNIFCCNCDKRGDSVCRTSKSLLMQDHELELRAETISQSDEDMFKAANTAGTGHLSLAEFVAYFGAKTDDASLVAKFALHDKNGDGYLQVREMRLD
ncbi:hypothetical protein CC86DRAFT_375492 [Ophiobolus disseminans]|uniref:EF-hand domain-containing protein n=1 Tax=Ophiobolus disseminans TaxID=1469910 RepID=A0A6A6ZF66_9PLEO|nr:hypothetical protein CC86DRAFT_375492 [Ophiobolus disseminans]